MCCADLLLIDTLPGLCHLTADEGTNVLNDHGVSLQVSAGKQAQTLLTHIRGHAYIGTQYKQCVVLTEFDLSKASFNI